MTSLIVPAVDGDYGVLAMHQNLVVAIIPGLLRFQNPDGEWQEVSVSDGMMRIEDGEVLVLVDSAEWPASGGSGFISGHTGCNAINQNSTSTKITHTGQPNHYSGYIFTNTVMKAGDESMPSPTGGTETGHSGNGNAKITWMPVL
jgi:hypothetical protein